MLPKPNTPRNAFLASLFLSNLSLRWACDVLELCREAGTPLDAEQAAPLNTPDTWPDPVYRAARAVRWGYGRRFSN
jgi:hypothetical protein